MAKKRSRTNGKARHEKPAPKVRAKRKTVTHRLNTFKPNGAGSESMEVAPEDEKIPVGEAMRRAVEQLGEVTIDDGLAAGQLRELGEAYEEVVRAQAAYDSKAETAKVAKKALESTQNLVLEKIRSFTHAKPLPLFDSKQAEHDEADMLSGGDVHGDTEGAEA